MPTTSKIASLNRSLDLGLALLDARSNARPEASNLLLSPASVMAALLLLQTGAGPELQSALRRLLNLDAADRAAEIDLRATLKPLLTGENAVDAVLTGFGGLYLDETLPLVPGALERYVARGTPVVRCRTSSPEAIAAINAQVSRATKGRIDSIIESFSSRLVMVILSALSFRAQWQHRFDPTKTETHDFQTASGQTVSVQMMRLKRTLMGAERDGFAAIRLPYDDGRHALVVVVGSQTPATFDDFAPFAGWLDGQGFEPVQADLRLPRVSLTDAANLTAALDTLGLAPARESVTAFSSLIDENGPFSLDILHKVQMELDEQGTEASAATAILVVRSSRPEPGPRPLCITVDKPFMAAVRDERAGTTLVLGYIADPAAR